MSFKRDSRIERLFIGSLLCLILLCCFQARGEEAEYRASDSIECPDTLDFGKVFLDEREVSKRVKLKNNGNQTIIVKSIATSCGCFQGHAVDQEIEPNSKGEVTFNLDAGTPPGQREVEAAVIYTDGSASKIVLKIDIVDRIVFEHDKLSLKADESGNEKIRFRCSGFAESVSSEVPLRIIAVQNGASIDIEYMKWGTYDIGGLREFEAAGYIVLGKPEDRTKQLELALTIPGQYSENVVVPIKSESRTRIVGGVVTFGKVPRGKSVDRIVKFVHEPDWRLDKIVCDGVEVQFDAVSDQDGILNIRLKYELKAEVGLKICDCEAIDGNGNVAVRFKTVAFHE